MWNFRSFIFVLVLALALALTACAPEFNFGREAQFSINGETSRGEHMVFVGTTPACARVAEDGSPLTITLTGFFGEESVEKELLLQPATLTTDDSVLEVEEVQHVLLAPTREDPNPAQEVIHLTFKFEKAGEKTADLSFMGRATQSYDSNMYCFGLTWDK